MQKFTTKALVFSGICLALGTVLSEVKLFSLPQGGSITLLSMLFISLPGYFFGLKTGLISATTYGILQFILGPYVVAPVQVFLDYGLGFAVLGVTGISHFLNNPDKFNKLSKSVFFQKIQKHSFHITFILACTLRFLSSVTSGVVFFAEYTPEGMNPLAYSAVYNSFIFIEMFITLILLKIPVVELNLQKLKDRF